MALSSSRGFGSLRRKNSNRDTTDLFQHWSAPCDEGAIHARTDDEFERQAGLLPVLLVGAEDGSANSTKMRRPARTIAFNVVMPAKSLPRKRSPPREQAIEAGDSIFTPRMKALLLRAVVLARRRKHLADTTRRSYQGRLDRERWTRLWCWHPPTNTASGCANVTARCAATFSPSWSIRTFHRITMAARGNCGPQPHTAKLQADSVSKWGADLFAGIRSVVGTAARRGTDAYRAIRAVLGGEFVIQGGMSRYSEQVPTRPRQSARRARHLIIIKGDRIGEPTGSIIRNHYCPVR